MRQLHQEDFNTIRSQAVQARAAILHMTTLANSGHPGGSMSALEILLTIYAMANHNPANPFMPDRDRVVVSNGHISPGVYSTLATHGYFSMDSAISEYRLAGSLFEGHIERNLPGVEWTTGNLGQGLSAGCGFALANSLKGWDTHTFVVMGDGEQQKGQISEARRFAVKYRLNNITAIIDYNQLQIGGSIHDVMPQNICYNWEADGWAVLETNGHDVQELYEALHQAASIDKPVLILAHTIMGKGVSFMENQHKFHGAAITPEQLQAAMQELKQPYRLDYYQQLRHEKKEKGCTVFPPLPSFQPAFDAGTPRVYDKDNDNRSAWGNAIADIAAVNAANPMPNVIFDCDLQGSVKTQDFARVSPQHFIQAGIMEHNTSVVSGAMSVCDIQTWWADFGMFGIDEVYNMHRLSDINHANLKVVTTHVGMDVGEDGRTHQCIDYIGLLRNLFHFGLLIPADPNHTDRIIRWLANQAGNYAVCMGRSKLPIIGTETGDIVYDASYSFEYGKADCLRNGNKAAVIVTGTPVGMTIEAVDNLRAEGLDIALWYVSAPLAMDMDMIRQAASTGCIVTVEDHNVHSGLGSIVADALIEHNLCARLLKLGVKEYMTSGTSDDVYKAAGLDSESIKHSIREYIR